MTAPLPSVVVVGAMKCATSAVHRYLDAHPEVSMATQKEVNFFNGPAEAPAGDSDQSWVGGQWFRGVDWYAAQFDGSAPVRGEASPAYTSPSFPEVPARMAAVLPGARLVYLVREPLARALSQYAHHRRDGAETRDVAGALLDEDNQYLARSRYFSRLEPFLDHYPREQVLVLVQERLLDDRDRELTRLYRHAGVDPDWRDASLRDLVHVGGTAAYDVPAEVATEFRSRVGEDVARLRAWLRDPLSEWSTT